MSGIVIGVEGSGELVAPAEFWATLGNLASVTFCFSRSTSEFERAHAFVLLDPDERALAGAIARRKRCFVVSPTKTFRVADGEKVRFAADCSLDERLRGRTVAHGRVIIPTSSESTWKREAQAWIGGQVAW